MIDEPVAAARPRICKGHARCTAARVGHLRLRLRRQGLAGDDCGECDGDRGAGRGWFGCGRAWFGGGRQRWRRRWMCRLAAGNCGCRQKGGVDQKKVRMARQSRQARPAHAAIIPRCRLQHWAALQPDPPAPPSPIHPKAQAQGRGCSCLAPIGWAIVCWPFQPVVSDNLDPIRTPAPAPEANSSQLWAPAGRPGSTWACGSPFFRGRDQHLKRRGHEHTVPCACREEEERVRVVGRAHSVFQAQAWHGIRQGWDKGLTECVRGQKDGGGEKKPTPHVPVTNMSDLAHRRASRRTRRIAAGSPIEPRP